MARHEREWNIFLGREHSYQDGERHWRSLAPGQVAWESPHDARVAAPPYLVIAVDWPYPTIADAEGLNF